MVPAKVILARNLLYPDAESRKSLNIKDLRKPPPAVRKSLNIKHLRKTL